MAFSAEQVALGKLVAAYLLHESDRLKAQHTNDSQSLRAAAQCVAAAYGIGQNAPSAALEARTDVASLVEAALNKQQAAEAKKNEGNAYTKAGEYEAAYTSYSEALRLHPTAVYYANRAFVLNQLSRYHEALVDCDSSILADPEYAKAHLRKGGALEGLRRYAEAKEAFMKAAALHPSFETQLDSFLDRHADALEETEPELEAVPEAEQPRAAAPSTASLGNLLSGLGAPGGLQGLLSNPAVMGMASSVLSNPAMMGQVSSLLGGLNRGAAPGAMDVDADVVPEDDEPIIEEPDDDVRSVPEPAEAAAGGAPDWGAMLGSALGGGQGAEGLMSMANTFMQANPDLASTFMANLGTGNNNARLDDDDDADLYADEEDATS